MQTSKKKDVKKKGEGDTATPTNGERRERLHDVTKASVRYVSEWNDVNAAE